MSSSANPRHLSQRSIDVVGIQKILEDLGKGLDRALFAPTVMGMEKCVDDELRDMASPLLHAPDFPEEVSW